jgi:hypothetical protein
MQQGKAKSYLEVGTNVAVLAVALLLLGSFLWGFWHGGTAPLAERGLRRGDPFNLVPGISYRDAARTLILAMSVRCEYCADSIPFYKRLLETRASNEGHTRVVSVFAEGLPEVTRYLADHSLELEAVPMVNHKALGLPGTPAAVLVDQQGNVVDFWFGQMSQDAERQVLEAITR